MTTDDPRPEAPSVASLAEDLTLSNQEGSSWFSYDLDDQGDLLVSLYTEVGEVEKTFRVRMEFEELT